jgi:hypothetical protein
VRSTWRCAFVNIDLLQPESRDFPLEAAATSFSRPPRRVAGEPRGNEARGGRQAKNNSPDLSKKGLSYFEKYIKPTPILLPINILEDFTKPLSLSFRLFGNILADELVVVVLVSLVVWLHSGTSGWARLFLYGPWCHGISWFWASAKYKPKCPTHPNY